MVNTYGVYILVPHIFLVGLETMLYAFIIDRLSNCWVSHMKLLGFALH